MNNELSQRILLKMSGELFLEKNQEYVTPLVDQLCKLSTLCTLGIVIGGGNFFRGKHDSKRLGMCESAGHEIGMLATLMNGRILQNLLNKKGAQTSLMSSFSCPFIADEISSRGISKAVKHNRIMIFAGGSGNPFMSTDTTAVIRALQMNAPIIWKATKVDGIYDRDPLKDGAAHFIEKMSLEEALFKKIEVLDKTALTLAAENHRSIRVFNLFKPNALLDAFNNIHTYGSTLY